MAWIGYFTLDGIEFVNGPRTEAYAEAAGAYWLRPQFKNDDLAPMLGHTAYTTPLLDTAPWVDPDVPESYDFFGCYPLDVSGIDDSSRASTVVESTRDGGIPGRLRHATKSVVFNCVLVGANEKGVAYGAEWLRRALMGDLCNNTSPNVGLGAELRFVSVDPHRDDDPTTDPEATMYPLFRTLRRFSVNAGPTVTSRRVIENCGGAVWSVTFTGVAGSPYTFGLERPLLQGYLDPIVADPWVPGVIPGTAETLPTGFDEVVCGEDTWEPIYDPLCPALINPPSPPTVPIGCYEAPVGVDATYTNLATNPSVETNTTNWATDTQWTGARTADADAPKGGYVYRSTVNTAITGTGQYALLLHSATRLAATAGQLVGVRIRARTAPGLTRTIQFRLRAYAAGVAGPSAGFGVYTATLTEEWEEFVVSGVLPAGQDGFALLASPHVTTEWAVGNWVEFDAFQPWYDADPGPDSYFDGDTPDDDVWTYSWTGTPHASTSQAVGIGPAWDRRMATIPEDNVPLWGTVVPVLTLYAEEETRSVRVRLYADPEGVLDPNTEPCAYHTDLVVSYIPAGGRLVFDAAAEEVWVETAAGQRRRADSLVFNTEGEPFSWPSLSCGYQHVVTVDVPFGAVPPAVDLSLIPRAV